VSESIRHATVADAAEVARLLHDFNTEFASPTPGIAVLTERAEELLGQGAITVVLADEPPVGLAMVRFRPSIWTGALDAYVEELYVAPDRRGRGLGRALLKGVVEIARQAGAVHLDLVTAETDTAARGLYESSGMVCREDGPTGPLLLYYERDL
jgi:ribosomal protein S18 acetylase RimI-like enzyme